MSRRISSRNSVGVCPDFFLKTVVKYALSLYPSSKPISATVLSVVASRFLASLKWHLRLLFPIPHAQLFLTGILHRAVLIQSYTTLQTNTSSKQKAIQKYLRAVTTFAHTNSDNLVFLTAEVRGGNRRGAQRKLLCVTLRNSAVKQLPPFSIQKPPGQGSPDWQIVQFQRRQGNED